MAQFHTKPQGRVLIIAGSDSGGGAGIQGDIKTVTALGGYAMSAITAVTVQNTVGVSNIHAIPAQIVREQIEAVVTDIGADAWKLGMLGSLAHARAVLEAFETYGRSAPMVLDPVMLAKDGSSLLADDAVAFIRDSLVARSAIVTPNAPEAEALSGAPVRDLEGQKRAADFLVTTLGAGAALVKGGHVGGDLVNDVLASAEGVRVLSSPRVATKATHGTGCTLASAIAVNLAQGLPLTAAVEQARAYSLRAIEFAPGLGAGHQPLGHNWGRRLG